MSYDYEGMLRSIESHRSAARRGDEVDTIDLSSECQAAVDEMGQLSALCPMTPMVWLWYASDTYRILQHYHHSSQDEEDDDNDVDGPVQQECWEASRGILELALHEFPGCALLHRRYLQVLMELRSLRPQKSEEDHTNHDDHDTQLEKAFEAAVHHVGMGSHSSTDGWIVASIYRLYCRFVASSLFPQVQQQQQQQQQKLVRVWIQRAQCPLGGANDALMDELARFAASYKCQFLMTLEMRQNMEDAKRYAAHISGSVVAEVEEEVHAAMSQEDVLLRSDHSHEQVGSATDHALDWDTLLNQNNGGRYLMGLGGMDTASAFLRAAKALSIHGRTRTKKDKKGKSTQKSSNPEEEQLTHFITGLAIPLYERAISECPTVESVWMSYIKHLLSLMESPRFEGDTTAFGGETTYWNLFQDVCHRSVRNCPYSVQLWSAKLSSFDTLANLGQSVLDPDEQLMATVKEAIDSKFLPNPHCSLEVHMAAIAVVKRRILSLISKGTSLSQPSDKNNETLYDGVEPMERQKKKKTGSVVVFQKAYATLDADTKQEAHDLLADLTDMLDATDSYLRKAHPSWTEGRAAFWYDRAQLEAYVMGPLRKVLGGDDDDDDDEVNDDSATSMGGIACFEKLVRIHTPPHPDSFGAYIQYTKGDMDVGGSSPGVTITKLRKIRSLYQRALSTVKKHHQQYHNVEDTGAPEVYGRRDETVALHNLCDEYVEFERLFGSDESHAHAERLVKGKLRGTVPQRAPVLAQEQHHRHPAAVPLHVVGEEDEESIHLNTAASMSIDSPVSAEQPGKRKYSLDEFEDTSSSKRPRTDEGLPSLNENEETPEPPKRTNLKVEKEYPVYKVKVGNLEYPAHPFTIQVSNLDAETLDMDLVDLLRPRCGAIVHARIIRKHHKPEDDGGKGLVQFEERSSVDRALELHDTLGLHGKLVQIHRANIPAALLVPPGMHRVNPAGAGRHSKRNQKLKQEKEEKNPKAKDQEQAKTSSDVSPSPTNNGTTAAPATDKTEPKSKPKSSSNSNAAILSFRPRGLSNRGPTPAHRRAKLGLKKNIPK
eukprot:scaffold117077_cov65-Attheya_sp.AAC.2